MTLTNLERCAIIRTTRIEKRIPLKEIAQLISLSVSAYSRLEKGETQMSIERLLKIAKYLEIPLAILGLNDTE